MVKLPRTTTKLQRVNMVQRIAKDEFPVTKMSIYARMEMHQAYEPQDR